MFQGSGFGAASTTTPFGQTSFGKPATSTFAPPVFGSPGTSLFGQTTQPQASSLFGNANPAPAFGQPQATTQPSFGGFTATGGTTSLFGNQQNATTGSTSLFGSTGTSAFGQAKPTFGFGAQTPATGLFGQQSQAQPTNTQSTSLFGQTAAPASTSLFGASAGAFGATTAGGGTTFKFSPVTGTDTMVKNGVTQTISTRHHCITCMKEYESKSLEELRLEDYGANRKGPQQGVQTGAGLFGAAPQPSLFGAGTSTNQMTTTAPGGIFGGFNTSGNVFGTSGGGLFGKTGTTTATGFGTTTNTTNTFGFNTNNTTTNNPFGANTAQVKPFGAAAPQPSGSLFGGMSQPSNVFGSQNTTGFGSFGTQPNQAMGGGLFNQNKPSFQLGATPTTGFSFGQPAGTATNTAGTQSLFGAKPAGTGFGSTTFGAPATNAGSTFGSLSFGQNNQSSLFGSSFNKPATTGFSFGQNQTPTSTLGTGLNLGGNTLFGSTANKPGGLFGSNTTGGGLFGSSTFGTTGGGLTFGGSTNTGLGGTSLNLGGTSLLGNPAPTNQALNNPLNQQIMALASLPYGDSPLFKNLLPITGKTDELLKPTCPAAQKALLSGQNFKVSTRTGAKIKVRPIGQSNLTKKSLFDGLEEDEIGSNWQTKPSPKRLVLKPKQTSSINSRHLQDSTNNDEEEPRSIIQLNSPRYMHSSLQDSCETQQSNDPKESDKDHSSSGQKKLSAIGLSSANSSLKDPPDNSSSCSRLFTSPVLSTSGQKSQDTSGPENTTDELSHYFFNNSENKENVDRASSTTPDREESICPEEENLPPHPTGIRLHRVGYYTIPHLDELPALMDSEGRCVVENFTIGRLNYGNVFYPDSFDVSGLNLDEIVHIRHKEVVIYPDDSKKPPVGEGLNRRAQVTLDRVWPLDRATRDPISDPERLASLDYEAKLRNVSAKNKTRFVEYRPQTGSWVFKVDHFSKYGLSDSDEEDTPIPSDVKKLKLTAAGPPFGPQSKETRHGLDSTPPQHKLVTNGHMHQKAMVLGEDDQEMSDTGDLGDGPLKSLFDAHEELDMSQKSPSAQLANDLGASSHKVQLMKHSFYHEDDDYNYNADFMDMKNFRGDTVLDVDVDEYDRSKMQEKTKLGHSFPLFRTQFRSSLYDHAPPSPVSPTAVHGLPSTPTGKSLLSVKPVAASRSPTITGLPPPVIMPQSLVLKHIVKAVPWGKSTAGKMRARCLADLALNMGHRFRVGWGPSCSLITLTTEQLSMSAPSSSNLLDIGDLLMHRPDDDFSPFITQRLQLKGGQPEDMTIDFQETIEDHLGISLNYSIVGAEDGWPVFAPAAGNFALHEHCKIHHSDPGFESVWELCLALWGDLPDSIDADEDSHQRMMDRKKAVSDWLETHVNDSVKEDLTRGPLDSPEAVFALLTGHQVYEACRHAQDNDNHYESLLLSQVGTGAAVRTLAEKQLLQWVETQADKLIDRNKLKLSMLVAGIPLLQATESTINICENLDWKRAFALHLWYVCSSSASVTDALLKYEDAFKGDDSYAASPTPAYSVEWETTSGRSVFDVCYHLLRLFSFRSHPLESLLNPATHTSDPLDYRMSWLLMQVVESLGYSHLSELSAAVIHTSFAAQLEAHGLWHWATFVLLHIKDKQRRQSAVMDMIGRHATLNKKNSLSQEELFLLERLNIPKQWLFRAKATLALSLSRYEDAAVFLLEAEEWNKAHEVIIQHIAAKAIINEKNEYIETLLKELAGEDRERSRIISGWAHQGALLWDYLIIIREIGSVIENRNPYALEKLQPQLGSLCSRIALLPTFTPMHRLCQTEIAKRTAHLVYNLIVLQRREGDEDSVCRLSKLVIQLPLPEDYSHPEMHKLVSSYLDMCLT